MPATPPRHPVDQPVFRSLMVTALVLGTAALLCFGESPSVFLGAVATLLFACFVVSFGLYWLAWVLREHELWRDGRGQEDD